jgi:hypothetical protein
VFFGNSSSKTPLYEDKPVFFGNSSSKTALFEDKPPFFGILSTYKAVSVDKPADYVQFRPTGALKNQIGAAKQHFISAKSFWRTASEAFS